jgi:hypothetical protein
VTLVGPHGVCTLPGPSRYWLWRCGHTSA